MSVSTAPMVMYPTWTNTSGTASAIVSRSSAWRRFIGQISRLGFSMILSRAFSVATAVSAAQTLLANPIAGQVSAHLMAQAIPVVTRADPTATRGALTEAYLSQPLVMVGATSGVFRAAGTLNLEGITLQRG